MRSWSTETVYIKQHSCTRSTSLISLMVSVDDKHHVYFTRSKSPGEIKNREDSHEQLDYHLRVKARSRGGRRYWTSREPRRDQEQGDGAGLRKLDYPLLQMFLSSCATDIVFVILLCTAVKTAISGVHYSCFALARSPPL